MPTWTRWRRRCVWAGCHGGLGLRQWVQEGDRTKVGAMAKGLLEEKALKGSDASKVQG